MLKVGKFECCGLMIVEFEVEIETKIESLNYGWLLVCWFRVAGFGLLVSGYWLLVVGCWLLVVGFEKLKCKIKNVKSV